MWWTEGGLGPAGSVSSLCVCGDEIIRQFKVPIQHHPSAETAVEVVHFVYPIKNSRAVIEPPLQSNAQFKGSEPLDPYLNKTDRLASDQTFQKHLNVMYAVKANVDFLLNGRARC